MKPQSRSLAALELAVLVTVAIAVLVLPSLPAPGLQLQFSTIVCLMLAGLAVLKYYGQVRS